MGGIPSARKVLKMEFMLNRFPFTTVVLFFFFMGAGTVIGKGFAQALIAAQQSVQWTAFAAGGFGILVGVFIGWLVFRCKHAAH